MHNYARIPKYTQLYAIFGKKPKPTVTWVTASFDNPLPMQLITSHETLLQTPIIWCIHCSKHISHFSNSNLFLDNMFFCSAELR